MSTDRDPSSFNNLLPCKDFAALVGSNDLTAATTTPAVLGIEKGKGGPRQQGSTSIMAKQAITKPRGARTREERGKAAELPMRRKCRPTYTAQEATTMPHVRHLSRSLCFIFDLPSNKP